MFIESNNSTLYFQRYYCWDGKWIIYNNRKVTSIIIIVKLINQHQSAQGVDNLNYTRTADDPVPSLMR